MSSNDFSQPWLHQHGMQVQEFGTVRQFPIALSHDARMFSCQQLNHILADTQILYALYKKHHWLMRGPTFYQLHQLLDKHADEQIELSSDHLRGQANRNSVFNFEVNHFFRSSASDSSTAEFS